MSRTAPWYAFATPMLGKTVRVAARMLGHGGSALPGRVVERVDPGFLARTLARLPHGVVLVSGTNGKTTTTRMVASMLRDLGLRVFTNPTGSNFTRGVVSALLSEAGVSGALPADIAVLELDEAYAVHFVRQVRPRFSLLLNVMRDQLDRFGEIDTTAGLLAQVARATTSTVVLNREDPRIAALAGQVGNGVEVVYFGLDETLRSAFPHDDAMHAGNALADAQPHGVAIADDSQDRCHSGGDGDSGDGGYREDREDPEGSERSDTANASLTGSASVDGKDAVAVDGLPAAVMLTGVGDRRGEFLIDGRRIAVDLRVEGLYNIFNAAAAAASVKAVMNHVAPGTLEPDALVRAMARVTPAFGRGESIMVEGTAVELLLVKNPMGFRMSLASFPAQGHDAMVAICDEYADGRDMSWLWDVDFSSLCSTGVAMVSGTRAWDMALRLAYDGVAVGSTDEDLEQAVTRFVRQSPGVPKRIYCTYTAMLRIRTRLAQMAEVPDAGVGR